MIAIGYLSKMASRWRASTNLNHCSQSATATLGLVGRSRREAHFPRQRPSLRGSLFSRHRAGTRAHGRLDPRILCNRRLSPSARQGPQPGTSCILDMRQGILEGVAAGPSSPGTTVDLSPSSRRRGSPSFWRAMARRRHFGHSARRRSRHRRCSRLVYCIAQHGYSRHVGLSTHPYSIFTSGRATKSVLARPPLRFSPASSYRHWPSPGAPAGADLITPAGRTRGSHQSGG